MKPSPQLPAAILAGILAFAAAPRDSLSQTISARESLGIIAERHGARAVQWIAEIRGIGGVPQPAEWEVHSFDERVPGLLYRFLSGSRGVADLGPDTKRYPDDVPVGFFSPNDIGVDSVAAFTIAEGEARKARMAFDSCNYLLRLREFSTDPLWRLELLDARRQIVGKIYISGRSGAVLRTVWVYRDGIGVPRIIDSFAPNGGGMSTTSIAPLAPGEAGIAGLDGPPAAEPNGETGIYRMSPPAGPSPGTDTGIASIPPPPAPGTIIPPIPPGPYVPGDGGIPDPPAISDAPAPTGGQMRDLREEPTAAPDPATPPIPVPSGGGSSERIPPPPIPPGP